MKRFPVSVVLLAFLFVACHNRETVAFAQTTGAQSGGVSGSTPKTGLGASRGTPPSEPNPKLIDAGRNLFQQNCAFCHGRDAEGGEIGPDLTRSRLVYADVNGNKIASVIRNGRPDTKMPAFNFPSDQIQELVAFIHAQEALASAQNGRRRGVDVADLQTGNAEAGKQYFNGAGTCAKCHSATGDLAGIASRYQGLRLEERMLYPRHVSSRVTVTLPSGKQVTGTLAYLDEFTVGLKDANGSYHSWEIGRVKYSIDAPVDAHAQLLGRYTDADIHNLMAYLQTLR